MDFLKMLLAYVALLSTLSVQEGPAPQAVPTPTMLPPTVTATPVPHQTEAPTATPGPSADPAPAITPNRNYETLRYQDRGSDVRKLQTRLIELGYMPAGSDDGAYGYQTYNAVRDFQRMNGLEADGVAGPTTLTYLYQYEGVRDNLPATQAPTATPTPSIAPIPPAAMTEIPSIPLPPDSVSTPAPPEADIPAAQPGSLGLTELPDALIIDGNTGKALVIVEMVDGVAVPLKPRLWRNAAGNAVVSLRDLVDALEGWTLAGSSADGLYTLQASGYTVALHFAGNGVAITVDGEMTALTTADVQLQDGTLYVTDDFLRTALGADAIFDEDERSLVLFLRDKSTTQYKD